MNSSMARLKFSPEMCRQMSWPVALQTFCLETHFHHGFKCFVFRHGQSYIIKLIGLILTNFNTVGLVRAFLKQLVNIVLKKYAMK